jgi:hypothetical protein
MVRKRDDHQGGAGMKIAVMSLLFLIGFGCTAPSQAGDNPKWELVQDLPPLCQGNVKGVAEYSNFTWVLCGGLLFRNTTYGR